jgi:heme exporter protein D
MSLGPHADFILGAYAVAIVVIALMIGWVLLDHRRQQRALADLESRGISRRSERTSGEQTSP